jgi:acyl dehydratase
LIELLSSRETLAASGRLVNHAQNHPDRPRGTMLQTFNTPPTNRFFEDYEIGATYACGSFAMSEDEIIAFARAYDPQTMHTDPALAATGPFGGIIASGWHTIACAMRLLVENFLPYDGLAAPGIDELRWLRPVRPQETLTLFVTVQQARRSRGKPDRGIIQTLLELKTSEGAVVLSMKPMSLVRTRNPEPA